MTHRRGCPIAINVSLYSKMGYDPKKDLVPVAGVANALNVLVVHPSLPVKSVKEFVAFAKAHPGQLNYGATTTDRRLSATMSHCCDLTLSSFFLPLVPFQLHRAKRRSGALSHVLLSEKDGQLYAGCTVDLFQRLRDHASPANHSHRP